MSDPSPPSRPSAPPHPSRPSPPSAAELARAHDILGRVNAALAQRVVGQDEVRRSLLVTLMTGGHVLLESVPGLAKTTAAAALARAVDGRFARIQCTPDLLPSDVVGTEVFDAASSTFTTRLGPVHANFVLLDEVNRASAKTQSAMLEAMQERQTSVGGTVHRLPQPFMVLATQNPIEEEGTYVLPHAQLDRFLVKEVVHYPTPDAELEVLRRTDSIAPPAELAPVVGLDDVRFVQGLVARVYVDDAIRRYVVALVNATRYPAAVIGDEQAAYVEAGASPRGAIALQQVARALAIMAGRDHVLPEDVGVLRHAVLRHRLLLTFEAVADRVAPETIVDAVFAHVPTP